MDFVDEFLQFVEEVNCNIWVKLCIGLMLLVFSFLSLVFSIKKNKVLSNSETSRQISNISKAMTVLLPAVSVLLDQKKGNKKNENESLEKVCQKTPNENE